MKELESELSFAVTLAQLAGKEILKFYKKPDLAIEIKADNTPVTEADKLANGIIVNSLKKTFPYHILSEEEKDDESRLKEKRVWCIDPLDGTKEFIKGTDNFAVMIGLIEDKKSILGVVYIPTSNKMYWAVKGQGAFLSEDYFKMGQNPQVNIPKTRRLRVSDTSKLEDSLTLLSSHNESIKSLVEKMNPKKVQSGGGFGYKICEIAEGNFDLYVNNQDKGSEWDSCAPHIILEEAGGKLTDFYGNELTYNKEDTRHHNGAIGSNGLLHPTILNFISENF